MNADKADRACAQRALDFDLSFAIALRCHGFTEPTKRRCMISAVDRTDRRELLGSQARIRRFTDAVRADDRVDPGDMPGVDVAAASATPRTAVVARRSHGRGLVSLVQGPKALPARGIGAET